MTTGERFRLRLVEFCRSADPPLPGRITVTVGVASYPQDARALNELRLVAERRLEAGQAAGGDQVVSSEPGTPVRL
jgi:GGDEF domain-containing protein